MIYGNKFLTSNTPSIQDIDLFIESTFKNDQYLFESDKGINDIYYLNEASIGNFFKEIIKAIKEALKKFGNMIKGWFTKAIEVVTTKAKNLKKKFKEKIKEFMIRYNQKAYEAGKKDMERIIAKTPGDYGYYDDADIEKAKSDAVKDIRQNHKSYGYYDNDEMKKRETEAYKKGRKDADITAKKARKDKEKDILNNPEKYGLNKKAGLKDYTFSPIQIRTFLGIEFLDAISFESFNDKIISQVLNMNSYQYTKKYTSIELDNKGNVSNKEEDEHGPIFFNNLKSKKREIDEMMDTMYPDIVRLKQNNTRFSKNYILFTEKTDSKTFRKEYNHLCTSLPSYTDKNDDTLWDTKTFTSLEDIMTSEELFSIGKIDQDKVDELKKRFLENQKKQEDVLNMLNSELEKYEKEVKEAIGDTANVSYTHSTITVDDDYNIINKNKTEEQKQVPKQDFLNYVSSAKNFISDLLATLNSMNNSFMSASNMCIQEDFKAMKAIMEALREIKIKENK